MTQDIYDMTLGSSTRPTGKIMLTEAVGIPIDKLSLSQANVRRIAEGMSIEDLAADIAHCGLLQSLRVRPILDEAGQEAGRYEVPAGGRRSRALEHLVATGRMAKTVKVPCIVRAADRAISATEDSIAADAMREALHPLDQYRALKALADAGKGDDTAWLLEGVKKGDMACEAERLIAGTGWLPEIMRTTGITTEVARDAGDPVAAGEPMAAEDVALPEFLSGPAAEEEVEALTAFLGGEDGPAHDDHDMDDLIAAEWWPRN
ncbi:ParB/RepB/Spo0J family partition protein [Methylobacterium indicum]|uniref:ParB-like N-terminal domain-containing protein n=1 Tax=Methylobacterium indicum TaxID=1775910 RepID=A0A8H8WYV9_9HYPH|nr:ParB/Srx family N-terminal domain-containing protein [Methylobacterium indicum]BCM86728.1 hypothetical protein mvi_51890 [Methylobacterium indicum]